MLTYLSKLWYYLKNLKYVFDKTCIVLIYHRVTNLNNDPQLLAVSPSNFESQIKYIKDNYKVLSLKELTQCLKDKRLPNKSAVITFDDGYRDNYYEALPVLKHHGVPATIFISTGMISGNKEFWWDQLEYIFLEKENFASALQLKIKDKIYSWEIQSASDAYHVYTDLHPLIKALNIEDRDEIMEQLFSWSGKERTPRSSHAVMSKDELKKLAESDLIEIGAHTCFHPRLSNENREVQKKEIMESKSNLEEWLGKRISSFSYPFGLPDDFNNDSIDIVKHSGFTCGIANIQARVTNNTNVFEVPRWLVRDWDVSKFAINIDTFSTKPENLFDFIKSKLLN